VRGPAMGTYGYARVSTVQQADSGESLGAQRRKLQGYSQMLGQPLDQVFIERGVSGSRRLQERPEGKRLLEVVQPGDTVLTTKLDRMFRSALDALEVLGQLKRQSVSLHMIDLGGDVTTDGIAKLVFTILSAVAEAERDRTRERIADVKRDQRARGRYLGGSVPFGWRKGRDGALVAEPSEQGAIRRMVRLRQKGQSLRDISGAMKNEGFDLSHFGIQKIITCRCQDKTHVEHKGQRCPELRTTAESFCAACHARVAKEWTGIQVSS
jgi:putative DNA-invertase from lambdoid prophage Rac